MAGAGRRIGRALAPFAAALFFAGGFPAAVMALAPDHVSHNVGYVLAVELLFAALCLGVAAYVQLKREREIARSMESPLASAAPELRSAADLPWRELFAAAQDEAMRASAERESRAKEELDDFLSSLHAIKTPATALSLMAERAQESGEALPLSDARLEIDELDRAIDRSLARLRLIDFDKGSRVRRFDAAAVARDCVRRHRRLFISRSLSARIEGGFEADSDPDWVSFIIDQLVSNAAKHAASSVAVELAARDEGGRRLGLIEVSDDGPGFEPEEAARAFGRSASGGSRADAGAAPSPSGYGLYLAREAARRLGASLELAEGEGARLRLSLPLSPGPFGTFR
jgi:Histidine kinase-, DNA gyrase B-, and HSP90-like ATPase.